MTVYIPACSTAIANCASCILNGENVECQSCNGKFYPATLGTVNGGQCAGTYVNTMSLCWDYRTYVKYVEKKNAN